MTIVITGANGQLGRALIASAPESQTVVALDRDTLDLARTRQIAPKLIALNPTLIVNAAAYTAVDKAESEPDLACRVNATAVTELALCCKANGRPADPGFHRFRVRRQRGTTDSPGQRAPPAQRLWRYETGRRAGRVGGRSDRSHRLGPFCNRKQFRQNDVTANG